MKVKFALSVKEPSWSWEESPTQYYETLERATDAYQKVIKQDGRFRHIRLDQIMDSGDWVLLEEIDLGARENSN